MLDSGLLNFANEVAEVGDRAGKEYGLEKTLNKMKAQRATKPNRIKLGSYDHMAIEMEVNHILRLLLISRVISKNHDMPTGGLGALEL